MRFSFSSLAALFVAALVGAAPLACSPSRALTGDSGNPGGGDGGPPASSGGLTITPANALYTTNGTTPVTIPFHAFDGAKDVTAEAAFFVDNGTLGTFTGATFNESAGGAGKTTVHASMGTLTGSTTLTIKVGSVVIAPGAPANSSTLFGGAADPNNLPSIVYPPDGVLVPPNLNELEVQFMPSTYDLFEIGFSGDAVDLRIYTPCSAVGSGCRYTPDQTTWQFLSAAGAGQTLQVTVRGTLQAGGSVGTSPSTKLSFGTDDVQGGLYYWAASAGGIFRYEFGLRGQTAEPFYTATQAGAICAGCHALSRNGQRIAVGLNTPGPAEMRALDVATRTTLFEVGSGIPLGGGSNFQAFTPDGTSLVTTEGNGLTLRDGMAGTVIGATPAVPNANMPDFSPDGTSIVFSRDTTACPLGLCMDLSTTTGDIYTVPFTGMGFGAPRLLVSGGGNNYYPAFSPDGMYVMFNRASGDSYDNMAAQIMYASVVGNSVAREMKNVDVTLGNSWPKWAPFVQHFGASTIFWITFSSRRPYGLENTTGSDGTQNSQIWMAAFEPDKIAANQDPSFPAFWLPFQDPTTGNHIAQWVEKIERAPCSQVDQSGCMSDETCENGVCEPKIQ